MTTATDSTVSHNSKSLADRLFQATGLNQIASSARAANIQKLFNQDAVQEGVRTMKKTLARRVHDLEDARDTAARRIKRAPLTAVGLALGAGIVAGIVVTLTLRRARADEKDALRHRLQPSD